MDNRMFFAATTALAGLGAAAILSTTAVGSSGAPKTGWQGPRQSLPSRVAAAAPDPNPTADAQHVFGVSTGAAADAHVPLSLPSATIEAGIGSDGSVCFDGTFPGRPQAGACGMTPGAAEVSGVLETVLNQPQFYFGLVGDSVIGLSVNTDQGSYDATLRHGSFFVSFPEDSVPSGWIATLADGSTVSGDLPSDNGNPLPNP